MKNCLLFIFLLHNSCAAAQTKDVALNHRLADYLAFSKGLEIDPLLGYMYPRVFEIATRPQMKAALENAYNNADIKITLDSLSIVRVSAIEKFNKGAFAKFTYWLKMILKLTDGDDPKKTEQAFENFKTKFGEQTVRYYPGTGLFTIWLTKDALAIKDNFSKNVWTFIGVEENPTFNKIIPADIIKKLNLQ